MIEYTFQTRESLTTFQTREGFIYELFNSIEGTNEDMILSIMLNKEEAEYVLELAENSQLLTLTDNGFDHDFGSVTGHCLVSLHKNGASLDVIVEDYAFEDGQGISIKHHETDILIVMDDEFDTLDAIYELDKMIKIKFEKEREYIKDLIF